MARRKGRSLTRQDVISAAITCLDTEGEGALGVNRVARELGIKPPSIYNHVQGNDDLRRAVAIEGWRQVLEHHRSQRLVSDHTQRFRGVVRSFRSFAKARPAFFAVTTSTWLDEQDPDVRPVWDEIFELFGQALAPFGLADQQLLYAGITVRATLQGFLGMERAQQITSPELADQTFDWMVERLIASFATAREPGVTPGGGVTPEPPPADGGST